MHGGHTPEEQNPKPQKPFPRLGSAVLVREANKILLGKRNKDPQRGSWIIPGGKIRAFETIAEAAAREIEEETGLKVQIGKQFGVYEIVNPPAEHRVVIYSWAEVVGGELHASDDLAEAKFLSIEELGTVPLTPLVRQVLSDAGYLSSEARPIREYQASANLPAQLLLLPIPLAGAFRARRTPSRRFASRSRRRRSRVVNSSLRFEFPDT